MGRALSLQAASLASVGRLIQPGKLNVGHVLQGLSDCCLIAPLGLVVRKTSEEAAGTGLLHHGAAAQRVVL